MRLGRRWLGLAALALLGALSGCPKGGAQPSVQVDPASLCPGSQQLVGRFQQQPAGRLRLSLGHEAWGGAFEVRGEIDASGGEGAFALPLRPELAQRIHDAARSGTACFSLKAEGVQHQSGVGLCPPCSGP